MSELNESQQEAFKILQTGANVFLTGAAGSGKSFLTRYFLDDMHEAWRFPVTASTGVAALLVRGRTFHSFFGVGIGEGGIDKVVANALARPAVVSRLKHVKGVLIDETSMLSAQIFDMAELVARRARNNEEPWGGLQVVTVGDFRQLSPVKSRNDPGDWCFNAESWNRSGFVPVKLETAMRTQDEGFLEVLNQVRLGKVPPTVSDFLNSRLISNFGPKEDVRTMTSLFPYRDDVSRYNHDKLAEMPGKTIYYETEYWAENDRYLQAIKRDAPIEPVLALKEGAFVMLRQNDTEGRWVNGSTGRVIECREHYIKVELTIGGVVLVEPVAFSISDADGNPAATAENFPLQLAWAITIHKSQGCTIDRALVDISKLWNAGQAYVAMSRVRGPDGLFIRSWDRSSIRADRQVTKFHNRIFSKG